MRLKDVLAHLDRVLIEDLVQNVHAVREYRNTLVHIGAPSVPPVTLAECGRYLRAFLSELPREW